MSPRNPPDPRLGPALRALREQLDVTQEDIAYEAGISAAALSHIETSRSNPAWTTVLRIAEALEVSLGELVEAVESA